MRSSLYHQTGQLQGNGEKFLYTLGKAAKEMISEIVSQNVEPFSFTKLDGAVGLQSPLLCMQS
jgi:hypothetical protein